MAEQLALPGLEPRPEGVQVVYFALRPDAHAACEARQRAWELKRRHRLRGRPIPPERLHISLVGVGDRPAGVILRAAERAAARVSSDAFPLQLAQAAGYGGRRGSHALVLAGGEGGEFVEALRRELCSALRAEGVRPPADRPFSPHLTLLYAQRRIAGEWIEPVSWRVDNFALIRSHFGQGRHEILGRWSLAS